MGRYVVAFFEHGRTELGELPVAFDQALAALAERWGLTPRRDLVDIDIGPRLTRVRPGPRWLGFLDYPDFRAFCRVMVWAAGVALDRRSPVLFTHDTYMIDIDLELDDTRPLETLIYDEAFLDSLDDIDPNDPLAKYNAIEAAFRAAGGMRVPDLNLSATTKRTADELAADPSAIVTRVRAPGVTIDAPTWSGTLTASSYVDGFELVAIRDIYAQENWSNEDIITEAIGKLSPESQLSIDLVTVDAMSAQLVVTAEQVRALVALHASLDVYVTLRDRG